MSAWSVTRDVLTHPTVQVLAALSWVPWWLYYRERRR